MFKAQLSRSEAVLPRAVKPPAAPVDDILALLKSPTKARAVLPRPVTGEAAAALTAGLLTLRRDLSSPPSALWAEAKEEREWAAPSAGTFGRVKGEGKAAKKGALALSSRWQPEICSAAAVAEGGGGGGDDGYSSAGSVSLVTGDSAALPSQAETGTRVVLGPGTESAHRIVFRRGLPKAPEPPASHVAEMEMYRKRIKQKQESGKQGKSTTKLYKWAHTSASKVYENKPPSFEIAPLGDTAGERTEVCLYLVNRAASELRDPGPWPCPEPPTALACVLQDALPPPHPPPAPRGGGPGRGLWETPDPPPLEPGSGGGMLAWGGAVGRGVGGDALRLVVARVVPETDDRPAPAFLNDFPEPQEGGSGKKGKKHGKHGKHGGKHHGKHKKGAKANPNPVEASLAAVLKGNDDHDAPALVANALPGNEALSVQHALSVHDKGQ